MASLVLASQSPRRAELLSQMGYQFRVTAADIDESPLPKEGPETHVLRLAKQKALTIAGQLELSNEQQIVVLAADTIVVVGKTILGKPQDYRDFVRMMTALSGSNHYVHTAIAVTDGIKEQQQLISTQVRFSDITEEEMRSYWESGEPQDKAGGYAIQAIGGQFVSAINGSYSAVVGLPMAETKRLLAEFGVKP